MDSLLADDARVVLAPAVVAPAVPAAAIVGLQANRLRLAEHAELHE